MLYFSTEVERCGTCYHEFQKGEWKRKRFWKEDSLLIHDDIYHRLELGKLISGVIAEYDPYGITKVSKEQWDEIYRIAEEIGGEIFYAISEANVWVCKNFESEEVFTILGI